MDLSVHIVVVDSEIINENYVATDSEIDSNSRVVSSFTFFLLSVYR